MAAVPIPRVTAAAGKLGLFSNTITIAGTDGSTLNVGTGGTLGTAAFTAATAYVAAASLTGGGIIATGGFTLTVSATASISGTNTGDNATNSQYSGLVSNATHTGDATGATALTLATVNSNVGSFGSATQVVTLTVNGKGLVTAAANVTITPAVGSITGFGSGVATALAASLDGTGGLASKSYADGLVVGLWDLKGATDASANPNYPSALKGDVYVITVAGKVGGASGKSVDVSDVIVATADNAGGTEASVGTSWAALEHNLVGALLAANNLSDLASASTARTNLGLSALATVTPGTGVATALAISVGSAGAFLTFNGDAGTPSAIVLTNASGTASININGTVGATTPAAGTFTTLVAGSATSLLLGTAGSAVGSVGFRNATSGTATLSPPAGALSTYTVTLPNAASTLPIFSQQLTFTGPTAARSFALPDAAATILTTNDVVTVAQGGTGRVTLTANYVLLGNTTTAVQMIAPSTAGNGLVSDGSTWASTALGANPSGTIGLAAVNGTATTYVRSDGAPALSQSIVPTWTGAHTFSAKVALDTNGITSAFSATGALFTIAAKTQTDSTTGAGTVAVGAGHDIEAVTFTTAANAITITDMATLRIAGPSVAGTNVTGTRKHSLCIVDSTQASSSITGALIIATTLGTLATSIGLGNGNINAGGTLILGGNLTCANILANAAAQTYTLGNQSGSTSTTGLAIAYGSDTKSAGVTTCVSITPTISAQTSTAGATVLKLNAIPTQTGSGALTILDCQWNSSSVASISSLGNLTISGTATLGAGTSIKNIRHGISGSMVLGAVTITDTGATANTRYFFSAHTLGTISIPGGYYASTRNAGASVVCSSSQATETSTVDWLAVEV